jgi:phosphocarrier protein
LSDRASATVKIANRLGLHARPATAFVQHAGAYKSDITVRRSDSKEAVNGKSIMELLMLAATQGTTLEITATGTDAPKAIDSLKKLVESKFGEE